MRQIFFLLLVIFIFADQITVDHTGAQSIIPDNVSSVWSYFEQIAAIPRCSYNLGRITKFLEEWANNRKYNYTIDAAGNVLIQVPATSPEFASYPKICIQSHTDMVCEKSTIKVHDFSKDPIRVIHDGDFIKADGTTLGADNGIGMALSLAAAETLHGPLELLFTSDEEVGLIGAAKMAEGFLTSKYLINLDSGEIKAIVHSCAGGKQTEGHFDVSYCPATLSTLVKIRVSGLKGGHSGGDIHLNRANAIKLLGDVLQKLDTNNVKYEMLSINGGSAVNAIPREAEASLYVDNEREVQNIVKTALNTYKSEYEKEDSNLNITVELVTDTTLPDKVFCAPLPQQLTSSIKSLFNGLRQRSEGKVPVTITSSNVGVIKTLDNKVIIGAKHRSSIEASKRELAEQAETVFRNAGATIVSKAEYSAWEAKEDSALLKLAKDLFTLQRGEEPIVKGVHGGLEPGIIGAKHPSMEMISISPEIYDAHSPSERLQKSTVAPTLQLLVSILQQLKK